MKNILDKYKERLINLSGRNKSLVLKKIYKKRSFDLSILSTFDIDFNNKILNYIFEGTEKEKCLLLDDPFDIMNKEIRDMEKALKIQEEEEVKRLQEDSEKLIHDNEINNKDSQNLKQESKINKEEISLKYQRMKETETNRIQKKMDKIVELSGNLTYLDREIKAVEKENGLYELFVGYPFVEGKFSDDTFVKAPLMMFPVRLIRDKNEWYLEKIWEQEVLINKVFILGYSKYNGIKLDEIETEISSFDQFGEDKVEGLLKFFEDKKIIIQDSKIRGIQKFVEHNNQNMPSYKLGELVLKNYLILGQFPLSNSIYNDYIELEKDEITNEQLKKLLINENSSGDGEKKASEEEMLGFTEKEIFFLTSLDYSQENAVRKVNETKQLVMYGPPGTGKSQTIANMISDALVKEKKVLMVSQKRAALDVIFNRLSQINSKVVIVHDSNKDKKSFYTKTSQILEEIEGFTGGQYKVSALKKAEDIDTRIKSLGVIGEVLHKSRDFGLTLQQMYSKSRAITCKEDTRYEFFKIFRNSNPLRGYKYQQIKEDMEKINKEDVIKNYRKYKGMLTVNPTIPHFKDNFDFFEADEFTDKYDSLLQFFSDILTLSNEDKRLKKLMEIYSTNDYFNSQNVNIESLSKDINNEENKDLLEAISDRKWWNPLYWVNYGKNKKQEEENKKEYEKREKEIEQQLVSYNQKITEGLKNFSSLRLIVKDQFIGELYKSFFKGEDISQKITNIKEGIGAFEEFKLLNNFFEGYSELQKLALEFVNENTDCEEKFVFFAGLLLEFSILYNIYEIEKNMDDKEGLILCSRFGDIKSEVDMLMSEKNKMTPYIINDVWNVRLSNHFETGVYKEFKRQANKKRMLLPLRKYISDFKDMVFEVFPCWLLSPETVSDILPLQEGLFDLIIFDEASQMFIENAIPTVYRGNQVVVAGDDKQLKPNSSFKSKFEEEQEMEELSIENTAALEEESLLDLAKFNYQPVNLNYHYRSLYDELINFSNYAFYGGKLQVSPNIISSSESTMRPIERIKVEGLWSERKNSIEATNVVSLVEKIFRERKNNETIGIITFNITQKDLIEDLLEGYAHKNEEFKRYYMNEIERKDGNEDVSLFVKNIENVQGDERDIVIFSTGYAKDERGRLSVNFGSLSQDGGENRLNVAISRAKRKIYIVTSIEPEELNVEGSLNNGPKLFKKYLQYAREVSGKNMKEANFILNSLLDSDIKRSQEIRFDSDFEMEVRDALTSRGYSVDTQVGVSGYRIDLAIYDKNSSRYILGIECDGAAYHSSKSARERDIHRQRYLESRGWKIARVWSKDWWSNRDAEVEKLESIVASCMEKQTCS